MAKINENALAREIALEEGGVSQLPIGQIKEVMRLTLDKLACENPSDVLALLEKHRDRLDNEAQS